MPIEKKTFNADGLAAFQQTIRKPHRNENSNDCNSFVMRERDINGTLFSVCNSANSQGAILSLKSMASPVTKSGQQGPKAGYSLLKNVLINNSEQMASTLYDAKFHKQLFESDCEIDC